MSASDTSEAIEKHEAYLAFGGNIGDVRHRIFAAWETLHRPPIIAVTARSRLFRTASVGGPAGQPDYLNAACRVQTTLSARELLGTCHEIEQQFGRRRTERWGPRTLDLDLLLYGDQLVDEIDITVPHPRLRERLFVLMPLRDVVDEHLSLPPDGADLKTLLDAALLEAHETLSEWDQRVVT